MTTASPESHDWAHLWAKHLQQYWSRPPRLAYWLRYRFRRSYTCLEIGAGSCRDSYHLSRMGWQVTAIDANPDVIQAVQIRFRHPTFTVLQADAFQLPFHEKSFALSFSNGFWGCFRDEQILRLLHEQRRVTSQVLLAAVHNGENRALEALFTMRAKNDPLYNIRFFRRADILMLLKKAGIDSHRIQLHKFGSAADRLYSRRLGVLASLLTPWLVPRLYRLAPWSNVERIICEIDLREDGCER